MPGFGKRSFYILVLSIFLGWFWWRDRVTFDPAMLKNKVVVVCGASGGIGEEIAYEYAKLGARLVLTARREERLQKVKTKCQELGSPDVHYVVSDFSKPESTENLYKETMQYFGTTDILILNHIQRSPRKLMTKMANPSRFMQGKMEVNAISYFKLALLFTPALVSSGGNIVVLSSLWGVVGWPLFSMYSATKHALHGFFQSYRSELILEGFQNVSVTTCVIGPIGTDKMNVSFKRHLPTPKDCAKTIIANAAARKTLFYFPFYIRFIHWITFSLSQEFVFDILQGIGVVKKDSVQRN